MGPPRRIDPTTHRTMNERSYHGATSRSQLVRSHGALAGMRNSSMGPPRRIDPTTHRTMNERSYHGATSRCQLVRTFNGQQNLLIHFFFLSLRMKRPSKGWVVKTDSDSLQNKDGKYEIDNPTFTQTEF